MLPKTREIFEKAQRENKPQKVTWSHVGKRVFGEVVMLSDPKKVTLTRVRGSNPIAYIK